MTPRTLSVGPFAWAARASLTAAGAVLAIEVAASELSPPARLSLTVFALAIVGWMLTPLHDTLVAVLAATCMLIVVGPPDIGTIAAGGELAALMLGGFVLAAALQRSGWLDLAIGAVTRRAGSVRALFHGLAAAMIALAFVVPSTTARAALMIPVVAAIATTPGSNPRLRAALALLIMTAVLLSAFASLLGAGAHMVAAEILAGMTGESIGFARWALLGVPFAAVSVFVSAEVILRLFLTPAERRAAVPAADVRRAKPPSQRSVLGVGAAAMVGWLTAPIHGIDEGLIALGAAFALTLPRIGALSVRDSARAVDWSLLAYMAAAALLAHGLVESGLAGDLAGRALESARATDASGLLLIGAIAATGLAAHLIVHSRTARVGILLPPALLIASGAALAPLPVMLATVAATGVCQTLMISAKPVMLLSRIDGQPTYGASDLLRLSAALLPLHLGLIVLFAGAIWPLMGVDLPAAPR